MRLTPGEALAEALRARGGAGTTTRGLVSADWASATFVGALHRLEVVMPDPVAGAFVAGLEAADLPMRGHFVASLAVVSAAGEGARTAVRIEALTIEDR